VPSSAWSKEIVTSASRAARAGAGAALGRAPAEQVRQDVAEVAGVEAAEAALARAGAGARASAGAEEDAAAVVLLALVGVAQDVVGRLDLLEALLGRGVVRVAVRVVLAGQFAVGLLDVVGRRLAVDAQDRIWISLRHRASYAATTTLAGRSTSSR
jgi:hypothetical protein